MKWGEVYLWNFGDGIGSEQRGMRPGVIVSNNVGNRYAPIVQVAPITSFEHKAGKKMLPTQVIINQKSFIRSDKGVDHESVILCEQIRTIDKKRLNKTDPISSYIGELTITFKLQLAIAVLKGHGLFELFEPFIKGVKEEELIQIMKEAMIRIAS